MRPRRFALFYLGRMREGIETNTSAMYLFHISRDIGYYPVLFSLFCAIPYANGFVDDYKSGMISSLRTRTSFGKYSASKLLACYTSGFGGVFLGLCLFLAVLSMMVPLVSTAASNYEAFARDPLGDLLKSSFPVSYLFALMLMQSLCGAFWAMFALAVSVYIPNRFVVYASPYIFMRLIAIAGIPMDFQPYWVSFGVVDMGTTLLSLMYGVGYFLVVSALARLAFHLGLKRRLYHAIV